MAVKIYRGQTVKGVVNLRQVDPTTQAQNPYVIPVDAVVEIKFPGETGSVVLSTANAGEVTILDASSSKISYVMPPAKSQILALNAKAAVDCVVTTSSSPISVDIFEAVNVYNIVDQANI